MNPQFEALPFELEGGMGYEYEQERGAAKGGGRNSRARSPFVARSAARAPRNRVQRPRPWPAWPYYYGPRYGGTWPYTQVALLPPEPDNGGDGSDYPPEPAEIPPTISAAIGRLPAAQRPAYVALGPITAALRDPRATGGGFYLIEFTVNGMRRAYSGQTGNLRRRLQQHALCGQMMGLPLASHSVYVAQSSLAEPQRRAVEYRIHDDMFRTSAGVLTNQRRELEAELFGHEWR